ncbi:oligosaccharide flippase family protein [Bacteroides pyogenes]|uniref:oligosaccharide flippase family protein n=1 Tax=Bacteroides pyogenes TaxID=310300 RepID=UPI002FDA12CB
MRMTSSLIWSFSGTALAKFLTLLAGIICARILQKEAYGEFSMVRSTINMFIVFGTAGLDVTATKYISTYRKNHKEKIPLVYCVTKAFGVATAIITAVIMLASASLVATSILRHPHLTFPLRIGSVLLFFSILNAVQNGALMGFEDFRAIAVNTLKGSICEALFMTAGAYFYGVNGAILGFGIGFIAIFATNRLSIRRHFKNLALTEIPFSQLRIRDFKIIYTYSLPAALSALLITPSFWIIRSLLVNADGFQELATFEAADQWKIIILFVPSAISQIVLPILSSLLKDKNTFTNTFTTTLKYNLLIVGAVSFIFALCTICFSHQIMLLYGSTYTNTTPLNILAVSTIFSALANVLEMAIYSVDGMWQCFFINCLWATSMITFTYIFISKGYGADGLSLAILIAYIISFVIFSLYTVFILRKNNK